MQYKQLLAFALSLATSNAASQGFNYGATNSDGSYKQQTDFQNEFLTAKNLVGTSGFTSARLYTMIQGGTTSDVISAIPAAIAENTTLLLGLWASGSTFDNELTALKSAISTYGDSFAKLVVGISVGSEDLYRNSVTGVQANAGIGTNPDTLVSYIQQVRSAISGTALSGAKIGHVDTWNAWANSSNSAVASACDWLGMDAYPYFQSTQANSVDNGKTLFNDALTQVQAVASGKEVWITETGWPVSGPTENQAVANLANAKTYWDQVGCPLFGKTNTWWYTLQDAYPTTPSPSFGIVGAQLSTTPLFDLSCNVTTANNVTTAKNATSSAAAAAAAAAAKSSGAASAAAVAASATSGAGAAAGASAGASAICSGASAVASGASEASKSSSGSSTVSHAASVSGHIATPSANATWTISLKPSVTSTATGSAGSASGSAAALFTSGASTTTSGSMIAVIGAIFAAVQAL